jgi:hypothetical protein
MLVSIVPISTLLAAAAMRPAVPGAVTVNPVLRCRALGHRFRFRAEGATMVWACERCGENGSKRYASAADATRYACAFDREDRDDLGRRAPLVGLFPLRLLRAWRRRAG